jgi:hypothetical protein
MTVSQGAQDKEADSHHPGHRALLGQVEVRVNRALKGPLALPVKMDNAANRSPDPRGRPETPAAPDSPEAQAIMEDPEVRDQPARQAHPEGPETREAMGSLVEQANKDNRGHDAAYCPCPGRTGSSGVSQQQQQQQQQAQQPQQQQQPYRQAKAKAAKH